MADEQAGESTRVDSWIWSVRLTRTRSQAAAACRAGHVRVNGERVKPAHPVKAGDQVRLRHPGQERIVTVRRVIRKRVGAPIAAECFTDHTPPPPPREFVAAAGHRDRGSGRPTKRDRRELERLRDRGPGEQDMSARPRGVPNASADAHPGRPRPALGTSPPPERGPDSGTGPGNT